MRSAPQSTLLRNAIVVGVGGVLAVGAFMVRRAEGRTNKVALASTPQPVSVVQAVRATYRPTRNFGGTFESWVSADVGPQRIAAFVDTVLVRPGAQVKRGDVVATLDCGTASSTSRAISMNARAIAARQQAIANQTGRVEKLADRNFIAENEIELARAQSAEEQARLEAETAKLAALAVAVDDCTLRAPFDGEVAARHMDPGAFARPEHAIVTVIDRSTVRLTADAPETDYDVVAPGTRVRVKVYATNTDVDGHIARRTPITDAETRTIRFEVDVPAPLRDIPANTTGEVFIDVGDPVPAIEVPLAAASIQDKRAMLFVVEAGIAHARSFAVRGEAAGSLFLEPDLAPGSRVVTAGRTLLADGDRVTEKERAP
jgi:RND family efflux transporter MFP subunit